MVDAQETNAAEVGAALAAGGAAGQVSEEAGGDISAKPSCVYEGLLTAELLTPGPTHGHSSLDRGAKEEAGGTYERCQHPNCMCLGCSMR